MYYYGYIHCIDTTHVCQILGHTCYIGSVSCLDTTHTCSITGYVISDSTRYPDASSVVQKAILDQNNFSLTLVDWTYSGGRQQDATTWVDGTFMHRWFDPYQVFYSIWSQDSSVYDGYRYREPVRKNVGSYYASMTAPEIPGNYEMRWTYLKTIDSYAKVRIQNFITTRQV